MSESQIEISLRAEVAAIRDELDKLIEELKLLDGWYKQYGLWFCKSKDWEFGKYWQNPEGKGDCIANTCMRIIEQNDRSEWAFTAMMIISDLLLEGKRWPDEMNHDLDADNMIEHWLSGVYRPQNNMTRDSYVYAMCLAIHLRLPQYVKATKIPLHLQRPGLISFKKVLLRNTKWSRFWFKVWTFHIFSKPDYVLRMDKFMNRAICIDS